MQKEKSRPRQLASNGDWHELHSLLNGAGEKPGTKWANSLNGVNPVVGWTLTNECGCTIAIPELRGAEGLVSYGLRILLVVVLDLS
jgi:hypothetical protein